MTKRLLFISAAVLALSSVGFGQWYFDWGYTSVSGTLGSGYADPVALGFALPLGPQAQVVVGYMGQEVGTGPGPGSAASTQSGYITSTLATGTSTTSASVTGTQTGFALGDGTVSTDSEAFVLIWQW